MMTREMVLELLATAGDDLTVTVDSRGDISVTVEDFIGFDQDWNEVERELDDEDLVNAIEDKLSEACLSENGDLYHYIHFDGFSVCWGYASFDI